jgi:glycosyltransferase involved in cell wall biosynthesis
MKRSEMHPLVTIVTPSYNMARYLPETIASVLSQDYPEIEYIVIDGGSTDGTSDLLESYQDHRFRYRIGKDRGASDAIHQGLSQAKGEILAWINADDTYLPGAVRTAAEFLRAHPEMDVVYGEGYWIDEAGARIGPYPTRPFRAKALERDCFICQPACFFRASAYQRCGLDPSLDVSFDYDLWIRMAKQGLRFASIPEFLANSRIHRGAKTLKEREAVFQTSMRLLQQHYGYVPFQWIFGYTSYRIDGRDQFFQPLQPTIHHYLASLPLGLRMNPQRRLQFLREWITAPFARLTAPR